MRRLIMIEKLLKDLESREWKVRLAAKIKLALI